jgi:hypothetical protein
MLIKIQTHYMRTKNRTAINYVYFNYYINYEVNKRFKGQSSGIQYS